MSIKSTRVMEQDGNQYLQAADGLEELFAGRLGDRVKGGRTLGELALDLRTSGGRYKEIIQGEQDLKNKRAALRHDRKAMRADLDLIHSFVEVQFRPEAPQVSIKFGFSPKKTPAPRTLEEQQAINDNIQRSRKVLGTKGPKQKKAALEAARVAELALTTAGSTASDSAEGATAEPAPSSLGDIKEA